MENERFSDVFSAQIIAHLELTGAETVIIPRCTQPDLAVAVSRSCSWVTCFCPDRGDADWLQGATTPKNITAIFEDINLVPIETHVTGFGNYDVCISLVDDTMKGAARSVEYRKFCKEGGRFITIAGGIIMEMGTVEAKPQPPHVVATELLQRVAKVLPRMSPSPPVELGRISGFAQSKIAEYLAGEDATFDLKHPLWESILLQLKEQNEEIAKIIRRIELFD